jgi:hypothetical protein
MSGTRRNAATWSTIRATLKNARAERSRILRAGWFDYGIGWRGYTARPCARASILRISARRFFSENGLTT